jgi:hypothetical protein
MTNIQAIATNFGLTKSFYQNKESFIVSAFGIQVQIDEFSKAINKLFNNGGLKILEQVKYEVYPTGHASIEFAGVVK